MKEREGGGKEIKERTRNSWRRKTKIKLEG